MTVTVFGNTYACTRAERQGTTAWLYDGAVLLATFEGVSDFSVFTLSGGAWSYPVSMDITATSATLNGGNLAIDVGENGITTGTLVKFTAPCTCAQVTGGILIQGQTYTVIDTVGAVATGKAGIWEAGAIVSVVLDKEQNKAFVQNGPIAKVADDLAAHAADEGIHIKRKVIASRVRDPGKPDYGLGGGGDETVALLTGPYTGTAEITLQVEDTEYDAQNMSSNQNAPNGTIIIKKVED